MNDLKVFAFIYLLNATVRKYTFLTFIFLRFHFISLVFEIFFCVVSVNIMLQQASVFLKFFYWFSLRQTIHLQWTDRSSTESTVFLVFLFVISVSEE